MLYTLRSAPQQAFQVVMLFMIRAVCSLLDADNGQRQHVEKGRKGISETFNKRAAIEMEINMALVLAEKTVSYLQLGIVSNLFFPGGKRGRASLAVNSSSPLLHQARVLLPYDAMGARQRAGRAMNGRRREIGLSSLPW